MEKSDVLDRVAAHRKEPDPAAVIAKRH